MKPLQDPFGARARMPGLEEPVYLYRLNKLEEAGVGQVSRLPFTIKVLLESVLAPGGRLRGNPG